MKNDEWNLLDILVLECDLFDVVKDMAHYGDGEGHCRFDENFVGYVQGMLNM